MSLRISWIVTGSWRDVVNEITPLSPNTTSRNATNSAKAVRDTYSNFFNNEGQVHGNGKLSALIKNSKIIMLNNKLILYVR